MSDDTAADPTILINELLDRLSKVRRKRKELEKEEQRIGDDLILARKHLKLWRRNENFEDPLEPLPASVFPQNLPRRTGKRRPKNPPKGIVVDAVCEILAAAGRPLGVTELYDRLLARDIEIQGRRPDVVLTTMLWRSRDRLIRFDKVGYWPADLPIASPHQQGASSEEVKDWGSNRLQDVDEPAGDGISLHQGTNGKKSRVLTSTY